MEAHKCRVIRRYTGRASNYARPSREATWFGGKRRAAAEAWARFGSPGHYVEPFAGSLAVLLGRPPEIDCIETVNDFDGFVANFWRALAHDPEGVARWADWPVSEPDLSARHLWLVGQREEFTARLCGDPDFYSAKVAGWWVWGLASWIGSGWCSGTGPWTADEGGRLVDAGNAGQGINRQLPHLGNAGRGINRQLPHLGDAGQGIADYLCALSDRLRRTRVCCGDWERICDSEAALFPARGQPTAVLLDPPYSGDVRTADLYACDSADVASRVLAWCERWGQHPLLRIALCGYAGEAHGRLEAQGWAVHAWSAHGGYGSQGEATEGRANKHEERIWFSSSCVGARGQCSLFPR